MYRMLQGTLQERLLGIVCYISIIGWVELAIPSSMVGWVRASPATYGVLRKTAQRLKRLQGDGPDKLLDPDFMLL